MALLSESGTFGEIAVGMETARIQEDLKPLQSTGDYLKIRFVIAGFVPLTTIRTIFRS
jgi:hypothetical protein